MSNWNESKAKVEYILEKQDAALEALQEADMETVKELDRLDHNTELELQKVNQKLDKLKIAIGVLSIVVSYLVLGKFDLKTLLALIL